MIPTSNEDDFQFGSSFLEDIIEWITDRFDPDEIYQENTLKEWAETHGYVKVDGFQE